MAQTALGETPTSAALEALDAARARLAPLAPSDIRTAFAAVAEATWWVAALDERIVTALGGRSSPEAQTYQAARERSDSGRYVTPLLWARDRISHQLPFHIRNDDTPFLGHPRAIVYISPGLVWRPSEELTSLGRGHHKRDRWRPAYDALLVDESIKTAPTRCSHWFHELAGHTR